MVHLFRTTYLGVIDRRKKIWPRKFIRMLGCLKCKYAYCIFILQCLYSILGSDLVGLTVWNVVGWCFSAVCSCLNIRRLFLNKGINPHTGFWGLFWPQRELAVNHFKASLKLSIVFNNRKVFGVKKDPKSWMCILFLDPAWGLSIIFGFWVLLLN